MNKVVLIGRLGKDPEIRHLDSGRAVANFSMATSERYKTKDGEKRETTEWHNVVLWSPLAEVAEKYLNRGDLVCIEGKITTESYEKDGSTRYVTKIVGQSMEMLGSKGSNGSGSSDNDSSSDQRQEATAEAGSDETDDLPF